MKTRTTLAAALAIAVAAPPLLLTARVTEPMVSPFCKLVLVKSVLPLPKASVCPYVLLCGLAATDSAAGLTVSVPV